MVFGTVLVQISSVKQFEVCLRLICPHIFDLKELESLSKMTELRFKHCHEIQGDVQPLLVELATSKSVSKRLIITQKTGKNFKISF